MEPKIFVAFRFHGNFYHSYRGDTPDELGFGKDIRIIRHIIQTLDDFNENGVDVCGTWDFENYFSLETIMPRFCPDIIENLMCRIQDGVDEIELMSYNNGLVSAHTAREFEEAIVRAIENKSGSGIKNLFGPNFRRIVRPQEMMYTPIHLKLYKAFGVDMISLYYSALPFNGFSSFIPPLSTVERYNPLILEYPGIDETMLLIPCYNIGDLIDHITLRRWVKNLRKKQLDLENPQDMLLLIDMDADDEFWIGFDIPFIKNVFSTAKGLKGLVENILDLEYVRFTTPGRYLEDHNPVNSIVIRQDTADGSFDGNASWSEKWSNQQLWTGLERSRILELQTRHLMSNTSNENIEKLLSFSFETRLRLLSTTHFGMAAPVMNLARERIAIKLASESVNAAAEAFRIVAGSAKTHHFRLEDYARGEDTELIKYQVKPSKSLIRLQLNDNVPDQVRIRNRAGHIMNSVVLKNDYGREILFTENFSPLEKKEYKVEIGEPDYEDSDDIEVTASVIRNNQVSVKFDTSGNLINLVYSGQEFGKEKVLNSGITYGNTHLSVENWTEELSENYGLFGLKRMSAQLEIDNSSVVSFKREILIARNLPYIYIRLVIQYPQTSFQGYSKGKSTRLQQQWDHRWKEVMPCEIRPAITENQDTRLRVWKHNFFGHITSFDLNYGEFSPNKTLDNVNNQITHAWLGVSNGYKGLLLAQNADICSNFAFCPLRTIIDSGKLSVRMNPFGSYWGKQYSYPTADTGLGNFLATTFSASDHVNPYAPSYNGKVQQISFFIAPYLGDEPPETIQNDAVAFAYPYILINDPDIIKDPHHRHWSGYDPG